MKAVHVILVVCQIYWCCGLWPLICAAYDESGESQAHAADEHNKLPTILIVTLFRNKAHTLPHFFTYLNQQDYPKERISLW